MRTSVLAAEGVKEGDYVITLKTTSSQVPYSEITAAAVSLYRRISDGKISVLAQIDALPPPVVTSAGEVVRANVYTLAGEYLQLASCNL